MLRVLCFALVFALTTATSAFANNEDPQANIASKEEVLAAIEEFRADPLGPNSKAVLEAIMKYGHLSDDVSVIVKRRYTPWVIGSLPEVAEDKLLGAFVAGSIEAQLQAGVVENHPYEGVLLQLTVYAALRQQGSVPVLKRLEKLTEFQQAGTLRNKVK